VGDERSTLVCGDDPVGARRRKAGMAVGGSGNGGASASAEVYAVEKAATGQREWEWLHIAVSAVQHSLSVRA
jgi:hypothetical protein